MTKQPVIAVFDIGKTNKKLFLFDQAYNIVWETATALPEIADEDGYPSEDIQSLEQWMKTALRQALRQSKFQIQLVNFSGYGASLVHVDENGKPVTPLYNYLKPYPADLQQRFYDHYGGRDGFSVDTASPPLGHLNSGLQLYWIKHHRPDAFQRIRWSLHLPQYLSFLFTGKACSDLTSIGCHTGLWHFVSQAYHHWVAQENISEVLAPIVPACSTVAATFDGYALQWGVGIHDSSAALIPYLASDREPFVLLSTGTWNISLNPFNPLPLSAEELRNDCLCYLSDAGTPVKASRLLAGHWHDQQVNQLAQHFHRQAAWFQQIRFSDDALRDTEQRTAEGAYHQAITQLVGRQLASTQRVLSGTRVACIFVDGGFSHNEIFMKLLARAFPDKKLYAAQVAQASAVGAAVVLHEAWNNTPLPSDLVTTSPAEP